MSSEALRAWCAVTRAVPVGKLSVPALGVRRWVVAMHELPGVLRGLSLQQELLPAADIGVLIDPLQATGLLVVPQPAEPAMAAANGSAAARRSTSSARAMNGPGWGAAGTGQVPGRGPGAQSEASRQSLMAAQGLHSQASHLANILQRHAASAAKSGAEAQATAGRDMLSPGMQALLQPVADRKVVYLPARQAVAVAMPDAPRAAAAQARRETNLAVKLSRWAQRGTAALLPRAAVPATAGKGLPDAPAGLFTTRLSSGGSRRLPSVLEVALQASKSAQNPAGFPSKPMVAPPVQASPAATPLALAVQAVLARNAGHAGNAEAAAAPMIESLARIVEQLATIEMKFSQAAATAPPAAGRDECSPAVQWLEDDDLAERLQGILRRQARRRGIDLS